MPAKKQIIPKPHTVSYASHHPAVQAVACPTCGVIAGLQCQSLKDGSTASHTHTPRVKAYELKKAHPERITQFPSAA